MNWKYVQRRGCGFNCSYYPGISLFERLRKSKKTLMQPCNLEYDPHIRCTCSVCCINQQSEAFQYSLIPELNLRVEASAIYYGLE